MIVRIAVEELKVGMFVDSMECSWMDNPFWRRSLLIKTDEDIARLVASPVAFVSIDTRKGRGTTLIPHAERCRASDALSRAPGGEPPVERRRRRAGPAAETLEETLGRSKQRVVALFQEARLGKAIAIEAVTPLVDDIAATMQRDAAAMIKGTRLKLNNDYTYLHSIAVCALMVNFAIHLGLGEDEVRAIGAAGLLHDIGKATTPEHILNKPGRLEGEELDVMRRHPAAGHAILGELGETAAITLDVCLHHHERIDGSGYPEGLAGDAVSLHARIAAICDVYDAVTSIRPYKRPWSPHEALAQMLSWQGHFDPVLLDAFIANLGIQPLGALVRLHSNRLGIVLDGAEDPTRPLVRTFFHVPDAQFVGPEDVDTTRDPVLRSERGDYWFVDRWAEVSAGVLANRLPAALDGGINLAMGVR
ncbi:HD-GYP domain-containing protein [Sphingomonas carotinifaciens]|uniref:HD-GYP domain-containing protein n=1 Tax=Sphingomonas carotinifaciens TaxID=1166323 RepID=UPI000DDA13C5|nr:HD-GYP domain-containing protein [Sphingomonas carotinifaciens]